MGTTTMANVHDASKVVIDSAGTVTVATKQWTKANEVMLKGDSELVITGELCIGAMCEDSQGSGSSGAVNWLGGAQICTVAGRIECRPLSRPHPRVHGAVRAPRCPCSSVVSLDLRHMPHAPI